MVSLLETKENLNRLACNPYVTVLVQWYVITEHAVWCLVTAARTALATVLELVHMLHHDIQLRRAVNLPQALVTVIATVNFTPSTSLCGGGQLERLEMVWLCLGASVGLRVGWTSGAAKLFRVGVVLGFALSKAYDQRSHGHFDV